MKKSSIIIGVVSGLVLLGFLFVVYALTNKPVPTDFPNVTKVAANDHVKWSPTKKNVLVEYGDFQCPACRTFHQYLQGFEASGSADADIPKNVTFVYRHFPLFQIHANANLASYASEAAANQDKFWEMYDLLYTTQDEWKDLPNATDYFVGLAEKLELDIDKFKADLNSSDVKARVDAGLRSGAEAQVNSTPSFYYNGKKLDFNSFEEFKNLLQTGTN